LVRIDIQKGYLATETDKLKHSVSDAVLVPDNKWNVMVFQLKQGTIVSGTYSERPGFPAGRNRAGGVDVENIFHSDEL